MILGEKEFKKPILDELGQNRTNIENWRKHLDQRVEAFVINWRKFHGRADSWRWEEEGRVLDT